MKLILKSRFNFGLTKFIYDAAYLNDPNYQPYNLASSSIHTVPKNIRSTVYEPV